MPTANHKAIWTKTSTRTTVATGWFSLFDVAGNPGAGTLNAGNTANGVVPVSGDAGYPVIPTASGSWMVDRVTFANTVASRIRLFDRLFRAGAYAFNANTALTSQPSFSGRVPGYYYGTQIWVEQVTAATGNQAVNVTYVNQDGTGSRTTGAVGIGAAPTVGRCWQLPLQAGDTGVQQITNVAGSVASAGTFNVMVLRQIRGGRINVVNFEQPSNGSKVGIYQTSALFPLVCADSTSSGLPDMDIDLLVVS